MQLDIWHITGDGFHFGRHGLGQEESGLHVPSDTLFAALIARLAEFRGAEAAHEFAMGMQNDPPPFALSSAFPYAGEVRFFPVPLRRPEEPKDGGPRSKDLKRVKFVSENVFRDMLSGSGLADAFHSGVKLHDGRAVLKQIDESLLPATVREDRSIWSLEKRPRVTVGRVVHNSQIYHTGRTVFRHRCGLWFGVRWLQRSDETGRTLEVLLAELGDAGLGGERSTGFGKCTIERAGSLNLPDHDDGLWVTLSRYLPRPDEINALRASEATYTMEVVGGWIDSPVSKSERRRTVRLLAEGAVLGPVRRIVPGQIVDVQPDYKGKQPLGHPVWRSGLALAVGLTGGEKT